MIFKKIQEYDNNEVERLKIQSEILSLNKKLDKLKRPVVEIEEYLSVLLESLEIDEEFDAGVKFFIEGNNYNIRLKQHVPWESWTLDVYIEFDTDINKWVITDSDFFDDPKSARLLVDKLNSL